jgi:hypothetical protein
MPPDLIGTTLAGRYAVRARIGKPGAIESYLAEHSNLDRTVIIKVLHGDKPHLVERFTKEASVLSRLDHPGIVRAIDFGSERGLLYLVRDHIDGQTLSEMLFARGPLPPREAVRILIQLSEALEAAHAEGVIHQRLTLGNVAIDGSGRVRITDFGLAWWLAPEDVRSAPADLAALGSIAISMLGARPGPDKLLGTERLAAVIDRLLSEAPDDHYLSAKLVTVALKLAGDDLAKADASERATVLVPTLALPSWAKEALQAAKPVLLPFSERPAPMPPPEPPKKLVLAPFVERVSAGTLPPPPPAPTPAAPLADARPFPPIPSVVETGSQTDIPYLSDSDVIELGTGASSICEVDDLADPERHAVRSGLSTALDRGVEWLRERNVVVIDPRPAVEAALRRLQRISRIEGVGVGAGAFGFLLLLLAILWAHAGPSTGEIRAPEIDPLVQARELASSGQAKEALQRLEARLTGMGPSGALFAAMAYAAVKTEEPARAAAYFNAAAQADPSAIPDQDLPLLVNLLSLPKREIRPVEQALRTVGPRAAPPLRAVKDDRTADKTLRRRAGEALRTVEDPAPTRLARHAS